MSRAAFYVLYFNLIFNLNKARYQLCWFSSSVCDKAMQGGCIVMEGLGEQILAVATGLSFIAVPRTVQGSGET